MYQMIDTRSGRTYNVVNKGATRTATASPELQNDN